MLTHLSTEDVCLGLDETPPPTSPEDRPEVAASPPDAVILIDDESLQERSALLEDNGQLLQITKQLLLERNKSGSLLAIALLCILYLFKKHRFGESGVAVPWGGTNLYYTLFDFVAFRSEAMLTTGSVEFITTVHATSRAFADGHCLLRVSNAQAILEFGNTDIPALKRLMLKTAP